MNLGLQSLRIALFIAVCGLMTKSGTYWVQAPVKTRPRPAAVRKPFPLGKIPIIMYHSIGEKEKYMVRSYANFKKDLDRLYKLGFRPVTLADYVDGKFNIAPGMSPVVLTFDDSRESQLRLKPDGTVASNCFVGQWTAFAAKHPDFPVKGTFFILPNGPFGSRKQGVAKVRLLQKLGGELASHTYNHRFLNKLPDEQVARELGQSFEFLRNLGVKPRTMALPFGMYPKNVSLLKGCTWKGKQYRYEAICMAWDYPARAPKDPKRNLVRVPRIEASAASDGIDVWLGRFANGKVKAYVK